MAMVFSWFEIMAGETERGVGLPHLTLAHYATCSGAFRFIQPFRFLPASFAIQFSRDHAHEVA